jgi:uncharacterized DUF497 family protein
MIVWDERKRLANLAKHGLDFSDAWRVYDNEAKLTLESPRKGEDRKLDLATVDNVMLAFIYTERRNVVRAISLRRASRTERRIHEKAVKTQSH